MRIVLAASLGATLALASMPAAALNVGDRNRFQCRSGDCANGVGVAYDPIRSLTYEGRWAGGRSIAGEVYTLRPLLAPTRAFRQTFDQDGNLISGDQPQGTMMSGSNIPYLRGAYIRVNHSFMRTPVTVIKSGLYNTGFGVEYRGEFKFIPAKPSMAVRTNIEARINASVADAIAPGYYIFYGQKVDVEDGTSETGLWISDQVLGANGVRFQKASPDYLAVMQDKYLRDLNAVQGDFQAQAASQRWRDALCMIGKMGMAMAMSNIDLGGLTGGGDLGGAGGLANLLQGGGGGAGNIAGMVSGLTGGSGGNAGNIAGLVSGLTGGGGGDAAAIAGMVSGLTGGGGAGGALGALAPMAGGGAGGDPTGAAVISLVGAMFSGDSASLDLRALAKQAIAQTVTDPALSSAIAAALDSTAPPPGGPRPSATPQMVAQSSVQSGDPFANLPGGQGAIAPASKRPPLPPEPKPEPQTVKLPPPPASASPSAPPPAQVVEAGAKPVVKKPVRATVGAVASMTKLGQVAQIQLEPFPEGLQPNDDQWFATNDGVYLGAKDKAGETVALKWVKGRGEPGGWLDWHLHGNNATFAPMSFRPEGPAEFSISWAVDGQFGMSNMNNGGFSPIWESPRFRGLVPFPIAAGSKAGLDLWLGEDMDERTYIFRRHKTGGDRDTSFKGTHEPASPATHSVFKIAAMADGGEFYAASGDRTKLYKVGFGPAVTKTFDLTPYGAMINTLIVYDDVVWVGVGLKVLRIRNDVLEEFATSTGMALAGGGSPSFCISDGRLYMAGGEYATTSDTSPPRLKSFLQKQGDIVPKEMMELASAKQALMLTGLYCAKTTDADTVIYTRSIDATTGTEKLMTIRPID